MKCSFGISDFLEEISGAAAAKSLQSCPTLQPHELQHTRPPCPSPGTKKDLHDPDNHDGVITHLEPDILESEVRWALGSITTNKASGSDGIPVELF